MTLAALMLTPRLETDGSERPSIPRPVLWRIFLLLLVNAMFFSLLGGALLTRYLLPMYPLVLLLSVTALLSARSLLASSGQLFSGRLHHWALCKSTVRICA